MRARPSEGLQPGPQMSLSSQTCFLVFSILFLVWAGKPKKVLRKPEKPKKSNHGGQTQLRAWLDSLHTFLLRVFVFLSGFLNIVFGFSSQNQKRLRKMKSFQPSPAEPDCPGYPCRSRTKPAGPSCCESVGKVVQSSLREICPLAQNIPTYV